MHRSSRFNINACTSGVQRIVDAERRGQIKSVLGGGLRYRAHVAASVGFPLMMPATKLDTTASLAFRAVMHPRDRHRRDR